MAQNRFPTELSNDDLTAMQNELLAAQKILRPTFAQACSDIKENGYGDAHNRFTIDRQLALTGVITSYAGVVANLLEIENIRAVRAPHQITGDEPQP